MVTPDHLKSLKQISVGAAPVGPSLISQFYEKAQKYTNFNEGWGLSEVAGGAAVPRDDARKLGSCNQPLPNIRIQVNDYLWNYQIKTNKLHVQVLISTIQNFRSES